MRRRLKPSSRFGQKHQRGLELEDLTIAALTALVFTADLARKLPLQVEIDRLRMELRQSIGSHFRSQIFRSSEE